MRRSQYYRVPDCNRNVFGEASRGEPRGLVITDVDGRTTKIGWSLCHKTDRFDRELAKTMATNRLETDPIVLDNSSPEAIATAVHKLPVPLQPIAFDHLIRHYSFNCMDRLRKAFEKPAKSPVTIAPSLTVKV